MKLNLNCPEQRLFIECSRQTALINFDIYLYPQLKLLLMLRWPYWAGGAFYISGAIPADMFMFAACGGMSRPLSRFEILR